MEGHAEPVHPLSTLVGLLLRLPPLFAIDALLQLDLGIPYILPIHKEADFDAFTANLVDGQSPQEEPVNTSSVDDWVSAGDWISGVPIAAGKLLILLSGTSLFLGILSLWTRHLLSLYRFLASVVIMFLSYQVNQAALNSETETISLLEDILQLNYQKAPQGIASLLVLLLKQLLLAECFWDLQDWIKSKYVKDMLFISFAMPSLLTGLPMSDEMRKHASVYGSVMPMLILIYVAYSNCGAVFDVLCERFLYGKRMVNNFGWNTFIETEWIRLDVPNLFKAFWILRCCIHAYVFIRAHYATMLENVTGYISPLVQAVLAKSCDTNLSVLGMSSMYSFVTAKICSMFQSILLVSEEEDSFGTISAILFVILAMQNGLTTLPPQKRLVRLFRNSCLLLTCMLHFIHTTLNPVLMSLSTSRNPSLSRHARSWVVCLFLIVFPAYMIYALYTTHHFSTWLFAVTAFNVEVIIKVLISLTIYSLFIFDAKHEGYWEELDDYVYWVKSLGNAIEFIFGILLFLNGAFIMIFESGGCIRAAMICIHAYFNIWCEARSGWKVFVRRKTAVDKIASLPEASPEELQERGDVCAICFHEMETAKITRCKHFFHSVCLRKWLYVQDKCPLCHETLSTDPKNQTGNKEPAEAARPEPVHENADEE